MRPPEQAYITGTIEWNNGSELHWKEYIDATKGKIEKLRYSYHYQDSTKNVIFRYDNALHKPVLPYKEHKHIGFTTIVQAPAPNIEFVVEECLAMLLW